jgi:hypothetical protein
MFEDVVREDAFGSYGEGWEERKSGTVGHCGSLEAESDRVGKDGGLGVWSASFDSEQSHVENIGNHAEGMLPC